MADDANFVFVAIKGNKIQIFETEHPAYERTLWYDKFWTKYNEYTKTIEIYERATMKLHQILPFYYFKVFDFQWNQQQSSFIVFDEEGRQHCVLESV